MGTESDKTFNITISAKIVGEYYIMETKRITITKQIISEEEGYRFKEIKTIETEEEKFTLESLSKKFN